MGAAAGKQFQSDKAKHAEIVLEAVQAYERSHPGEVASSNFSFQAHLFKRRVQLAVTDSKRRGKDIDHSLSQLTDADLETLFHYIENNRKGMQSTSESVNSDQNLKNTQQSDKMQTQAMSVEEFVEEETGAGDTIDETTSVLSYGDDDEEQESEAEVDSSGSLIISRTPKKPDKGGNVNEDADEILEDLELEESLRQAAEHKEQEEDLKRGVKIFPTESQDSLHSHKSGGGKHKEKSIAQALAKFWEMDDIGPLTAGHTAGADSPRSKSPFSPYASRTDLNVGTTRVGSGYKDRGQRIDERNERLMGLQRQKVMSYTQNAQLEREVEALQKQLERMEELERSMGPDYAASPSSVKLNHSMQSSASTIQGSADKYSTQGSIQRHQDSNKKFLPSKYPYIYPIDEDSNEWQAQSFRSTNNASSDQSHHHHHNVPAEAKRVKKNTQYHSAKRVSSSSDDSEDDLVAGRKGANRRLVLPEASDSKHTSPISSRHLMDAKGTTDSTATAAANQKASQRAAVKQMNIRRNNRNLSNNNNISGVDSDDSATSNYSNSNAANSHPNAAVARKPRLSDKQVAANSNNVASDSDTQPVSARNKNSNHGYRRQASNVSSIPADNAHSLQSKKLAPLSSNNNSVASNLSLQNPTGGGKDQASSGNGSYSPTKKTGAEARRARNTISTEDSKQRNTRAEANSNNNSPGQHLASEYISEDEKMKGDKLGIKAKGSALKKVNRRRHSVDGLVPSPAKELSNNNIDIKDPEVLEQAISVLKDVNNSNGANAMDKLLTPDRVNAAVPVAVKLLNSEDNQRKPARRRLRKESSISDVGEGKEEGSKASRPVVLNDDEFQALFASDVNATPDNKAKENNNNENSGNNSNVVAKLPPAAGQRKRKSKLTGGGKSAAEDSATENNGQPEPADKLWTNELDYKWAEVSLLLRQPIKSEEDMFYAVASAEAGIIFTDQMNMIAKQMAVLRGQLSRWILPYDNNTRIDTQCSTPHSVIEAMPDEFRGKLTERQVHYLVAGANGVRKLVRIKIADDNDLEQARKALQTTNSFFKHLYEQAEKNNLTPFELLQKSSTL